MVLLKEVDENLDFAHFWELILELLIKRMMFWLRKLVKIFDTNFSISRDIFFLLLLIKRVMLLEEIGENFR